jgi:hypothetical protein
MILKATSFLEGHKKDMGITCRITLIFENLDYCFLKLNIFFFVLIYITFIRIYEFSIYHILS